MRPGQLIGPLALIAVGVIFLIDNLVVEIHFGRIFENYWPLILIAAGMVQVATGVARGLPRGWGHVAGGVITATMGGLFQIHEFGGPGFGSTWPGLLVVVGLLGLIKVLAVPGANRVRGGFEQ